MAPQPHGTAYASHRCGKLCVSPLPNRGVWAGRRAWCIPLIDLGTKLMATPKHVSSMALFVPAVCLLFSCVEAAQNTATAQWAAPAPDAAHSTNTFAATPYAFPGQSLRPVKGLLSLGWACSEGGCPYSTGSVDRWIELCGWLTGIVYSPDPSDFTSYNQGGPPLVAGPSTAILPVSDSCTASALLMYQLPVHSLAVEFPRLALGGLHRLVEGQRPCLAHHPGAQAPTQRLEATLKTPTSRPCGAPRALCLSPRFKLDTGGCRRAQAPAYSDRSCTRRGRNDLADLASLKVGTCCT